MSGEYDTSQRLQLDYVEKVLWAIQRRSVITPEDVEIRWGVSRATAFRWRNVLEAARVRAQMMDIPRAPGGLRTPVQPRPAAEAQHQ